MSGKAWRIFLRSSFAHTMKAFMGRLMWLLFRDSGKWREPEGWVESAGQLVWGKERLPGPSENVPHLTTRGRWGGHSAQG